jgi:hypothetical protein
MSESLYEISKDIYELEALLLEMTVFERADGLDQKAIEDTLERRKWDKKQKIESMLKLYHSLNARAKSADLEVKRLQALRDERTDAAESVKTYLAKYCQGENWGFGCGSISFRASEGVMEVPNPDGSYPEIPEEFKRVKVEVSADKKAIKEALKAGATIPGFYLEKRNNIQLK